MLSEKEVSLVYETLLSFPGMNDQVKITIHIPRRNVLLMSKAIERGLATKTGDVMDVLTKAAGPGSVEALQQVNLELLQKAGLLEINEKIAALQPAFK